MRIVLTIAFFLCAGCHRDVPGTSFPDRPRAPLGQADAIAWEIQDRFRLVAPPGAENATEALWTRYRAYYQQVDGQPESPVPSTWWDASRNRYRDGYLQATRWKVKLTAPFAGECEWEVDGQAIEERACKGIEREFGAAAVSVRVRPLGGSKWTETKISPRDVLIVTLGDSYASGEGVPDDRQRQNPAAKWMDARCHRSLFSGHGLAALTYAVLNPHVTVTHVTFACSGALLREGILYPYAGAEPRPQGDVLPPQVDALAEVLAGTERVPDFLTLSAGGNDVGFAEIVATAALEDLPQVRRRVRALARPGFMSIATSSRFLKSALENAGIRIGATRILLTPYPDPTRYFLAEDAQKERNACKYGGGGAIAFTPYGIGLFKNISAAELTELRTTVQDPLRDASERLREALSATLVEKVEYDFDGHGYCAPGLNNEWDRWVNTARDSLTILGKTHGSMHPNIRGQTAIARRLLEKIIEAECDAYGASMESAVNALFCDGTSQWSRGLGGFEDSSKRPSEGVEPASLN